MRHFHFSDGKSDKFWSIEREGKQLTVTYGRMGSKGQTQTKELPDEAAAEKEEERLIREKQGKGYVEVSSSPAVSPMRQALEEALTADPDELAGHMAYADWLQEQGDPRGEFIRLQLDLERADLPGGERKALQGREDTLLRAHGREWLGSLAPFLLENRATWEDQAAVYPVEYQYRFARGWLDSLHIHDLSLDLAAEMARAPELRLLRRLVLENWYYEQEATEEMRRRYRIPEDTNFPSLYPLLRSPYLTNIQIFQLGEQADDTIRRSGSARSGYYYGLNYRCYASGEVAVDLVKKMPRLQELYLFADRVDTGKLFGLRTLDNLRVLQVYHCWEYPLEVLARNKTLGHLTHLLLHPKAQGAWTLRDEGPYITFAGVRALLRSPHLNNLTHLQLRLTDIGDPGCEEIVRSGILKRLKLLDLRHGAVSDAGARILASCPDLANLDRLELSRNRLTQEGEHLLRQVLGARLNAEHQQTSREEPDQYLYEGDYE
jgi:uncharacterized protein (TIGR02996 family)